MANAHHHPPATSDGPVPVRTRVAGRVDGVVRQRRLGQMFNQVAYRYVTSRLAPFHKPTYPKDREIAVRGTNISNVPFRGGRRTGSARLFDCPWTDDDYHLKRRTSPEESGRARSSIVQGKVANRD